MRLFLQYHNADRIGYLPGEVKLPASGRRLDELDTTDAPPHVINMGLSKRAVAEASLDHQVYMVVGVTENGAKKYYIWSVSIADEILDADDLTLRFSVQRVLNPPQLLNGTPGFGDFVTWCGNFGRGFIEFTDHPFADVIYSTSSHGEDANAETTVARMTQILNHDERAFLAWPILVEAAAKREPIT